MNLDQLIQEQILEDKRTGTCGIEEAGWQGWHPLEGCQEWMSEEAQSHIIAICSIINSLQELAKLTAKNEMDKARSKVPTRRGVVRCDLYYVNDDGPRGEVITEVITKDETGEIVSLWMKKGTAVKWNSVDQCWEDKNDSTVSENFVTELPPKEKKK
jgi:hypothetical protein